MLLHCLIVVLLCSVCLNSTSLFLMNSLKKSKLCAIQYVQNTVRACVLSVLMYCISLHFEDHFEFHTILVRTFRINQNSPRFLAVHGLFEG